MKHKAQNTRDFIEQHGRILLAVILQDMKTRFGGGYASYLLAIAWPLGHVAAISTGYLIVNQVAPVGDDPFIFVATAAIPYMLCLYPARLVAQALIINKPFLSYNVVKTTHLIFARIIMEFLNVTAVVIIILIISYSFDKNLAPLSLSEASAAVSAALLLGVGLGVLFAVFTSILGPFFGVFSTISMVLLYIGSLSFMPEYLIPASLREYLIYNPMFVLIKWLRSAFYPSYQLDEIPRAYVLFVALCALFLGLLSERFFRGRTIGS